MPFVRRLARAATAIAIGGAIAFVCVHAVAQDRPAEADAHADRTVWTTLEKFNSDDAFARYLRVVREDANARYVRAVTPPGQLLRADDDMMMAMPAPEFSPRPQGHVANQANTAPDGPGAGGGIIADSETLSVEEGDRVKQIGRFLVLLQDGRLFSLDTRPNGNPGLRLVDRANVYRTSGRANYDQILIFENRIVVTGYNLSQRAVEVAVFTLSEAGALVHEDTYYLDRLGTNSAWLAGDRLVLYWPLQLLDMGPMQWPRARRWIREGEAGRLSTGAPMLGARDIYKPVQRIRTPFLHVIFVCPLRRLDDELDCTSTGIVGTADDTLHLSRTHAYLWLAPGPAERPDAVEWSRMPECAVGAVAGFEDVLPGVLFQIPLDGQTPRVVAVRGQAMRESAVSTAHGEFRALLTWESTRCMRPFYQDFRLKYFSMALDSFAQTPLTPSVQHYVDAPSPGHRLTSRFADRYLVYGGRGDLSEQGPNETDATLRGRVVSIPVANPRSAIVTETPHEILRVERAGAYIVLTGLRDARGQSFSLLDLRGAPRLASTAALAGRYESIHESQPSAVPRPHAFGSRIETNGAGLFGAWLVEGRDESGRPPREGGPSNVAFLSLDAAGRLSSIGALSRGDTPVAPDYQCEIYYCDDWEDDTGPIFMDGRVFAWIGADLIEGAIRGNRIREIRRINLTTPPQADATDRR